jgi:nucleotide-binding universal stress UspA family protein
MYQKILVPVDGSKPSRRGLDEAVAIAKHLRSRLFLLHIVNEFVFDQAYSPAAYATNLIDALRERGRDVLREAEGVAQREGVETAAILIEAIGGPAADLIVAQAVEVEAELILMGTHGRRGLRRLALGSDAEQVVRRSEVPVLLVRDGPATA